MLYKSLVFADSPLNLTSTNLDSINANQNSFVIDFNTTGGVIVVNLPSIASLLFATNSGAGALTFYMKGTIVTGGNSVSLIPAQGDDICGNAGGESISGVGGCFHLYIAGRNRWGILFCAPQGQIQPIPPPIGN